MKWDSHTEHAPLQAAAPFPVADRAHCFTVTLLHCFCKLIYTVSLLLYVTVRYYLMFYCFCMILYV